MAYVADLDPATAQVVIIRTVPAALTAETTTVKNVSDTQYAAMKDNAIQWHWDVTTAAFALGILPAPNANATPMGALDLAKWDAKQKISAFAEATREQLAGGATAREVAGWPRYTQLADKVDAGTATAADLQALQLECSLRGQGETVAQLVVKIHLNATKYTIANSAINGMVKAALTAIDGAKDPAGVLTLLAGLKAQATAQINALTGGVA